MQSSKRVSFIVAVLVLAALPFVPEAAAQSADPGIAQIDTLLTVRVGFDSVTVPVTEDSITIVVSADWDAFGLVDLYASYEGGYRYRATSARGIPPGQIGYVVIPWQPRSLRIGPSRLLDLDPGDVVIVQYPQDYQVGGWLRRLAPD